MAPPGDILSDPEIAQAYEDVRSDKSETTWLVLKYATATSDSLTLVRLKKIEMTFRLMSVGSNRHWRYRGDDRDARRR